MKRKAKILRGNSEGYQMRTREALSQDHQRNSTCPIVTGRRVMDSQCIIAVRSCRIWPRWQRLRNLERSDVAVVSELFLLRIFLPDNYILEMIINYMPQAHLLYNGLICRLSALAAALNSFTPTCPNPNWLSLTLILGLPMSSTYTSIASPTALI